MAQTEIMAGQEPSMFPRSISQYPGCVENEQAATRDPAEAVMAGCSSSHEFNCNENVVYYLREQNTEETSVCGSSVCLDLEPTVSTCAGSVSKHWLARTERWELGSRDKVTSCFEKLKRQKKPSSRIRERRGGRSRQ